MGKILKTMKRIFGNKSNDQVTSKNNSSNDERHKSDTKLAEQKQFIYFESAYQHQEYVFRRATETHRITLGELLESLQLDKSSLLSMAVAYHLWYHDDVCYHLGCHGDEMEQRVVKSPEDIWNFDLFSCILKRKDDEGHYTMGMFHETTLIVKTKNMNWIFVLTSLGGFNAYKYMRVSMLAPDNSTEDDGRLLNTQNAPSITSFILSYCETDDDPDYQTYLNVEASTKRKFEKSQDLNELEHNYIRGVQEFRGYHYIRYGLWLFEQNRYYDAFSILKRAYNHLKSHIDYSDSQQVEALYDNCNIMGFCLSKINREDEASFYFRQGVPGLVLTDPYWPALSYAKLGNPTAIDQMNDWLMQVAQKYGDYKKWSEEVKQFSVEVPAELIRYKKRADKEMASTPNYSEVITIGYALKELWGIDKDYLAPCMFIYDINTSSFIERIEDVDVICDYMLNQEKASDKVFILSCSHAHYQTKDEDEKSLFCLNVPIVISTHTIKGKGCTANIRIDMMRQNFADDDEKRELTKINMPLNATYTIGWPYSISCSQEKESLRAGIEKAIQLKEENRFLEAYKLSKWIFERVSNGLKDEMGLKFESEDDLLWSIFFVSSYCVGFCLMELGKAHAAAYYLEIASHSRNYTYIIEYINCLSNTQDTQALEVVESAMKNSTKPESEEDIKNWNYFMSFLKRRKSYILIDLKRYQEAKALLQEMLKDPFCKEFAQKELSYLNEREQSQS